MIPHVLILGSGVAGLMSALKLAKSFRVTLVTKDQVAEGATRYAQGGIASVWDKEDSFESHLFDTNVAGDGLCHPEIAEICIKEGPERVKELIELGVSFTRSRRGQYDLHREGGHHHARILHADDLTGAEIENALLAQVKSQPNIQVLEQHSAIDLITAEKISRQVNETASTHTLGAPLPCLGAYVLENSSGKIHTILADATVLATGGAGKVYLYTSNPDVATGDGVAMAYRAGARVANLEFMQFHPTCLYHPQARNYLLTEALRGSGAKLTNIQGTPIMDAVHPLKDLAPRDIVARGIDMEMKRSGAKFVLLDATSLGRENINEKFPNIQKTLKKLNLDLTEAPIPVVPAAHYLCGGVVTDEVGSTTIPGLYAVGEVAFTGLHGANRLASNSLLESVVFSHRLAEHLLHSDLRHTLQVKKYDAPLWDHGLAAQVEERIDIVALWQEIRTLMWNFVGIVRSSRRLDRALQRILQIQMEVKEHYWELRLDRDLIELRNLALVSELMIRSALSRRESRGLHFNIDYPKKDDTFFKKDTIL